nr:helix-turn-helix domain-containing protein [uncultured Limnohabitans sp.]
MPENTNPDSAAVASDSGATAATAGSLLKAARQSAGVHLEVLSEKLKVPVRQLAALEADEYPTNTSPVFARGLAASICRQLRVDSAPILALLPLSANYLERHGAVRYANTVPVDFGHMRRSLFGVPVKALWSAVGMLVVISALIWLPSPSQWAWLDGQHDVVADSVPAPEAGTSVTTLVPAASSLNPPELAMAASEPSPLGASVPVVTPLAAPGEVASAISELSFSARNFSWIEVWDGQKQLIWNGVLNAGETKRVPAALPVSVVVGRADAVQLSVKGQAFDLKPHTVVNTARFEVKP